MSETTDSINDICGVLEKLTVIIKNMEARLSRLEGKTICPECNGLIELNKNEDDKFKQTGKITHICKYCDKCIELNTLENGAIEVKLIN